MNTLIIYKSIHLGSTKKIAETMGRIMDADVIEPNEFDINKFDGYELIGFGSEYMMMDFTNLYWI